MSEWEEKLNTLLSDPDAMARQTRAQICRLDGAVRRQRAASPARGRCGRSCAVCSHAATAAGRSDG